MMGNWNSNSYLEGLKSCMEKCNLNDINNGIDLIYNTWKKGNQIITLGNGGSSMTALHMITDWNKSIYLSTGIPFRGRTLVDNIGLMMAYANDMSFENIFSEQLKNILSPGDLVIAISGSGNSQNVINAIEYAKSDGGVTLGLSGYDGGKLKKVSQHNIWVDSFDMQFVEDIHSIFGHMVMKQLCN